MLIPQMGKGRQEVTTRLQRHPKPLTNNSLSIASSHLPISQTHLRPGSGQCYQDRVVLYLWLYSSSQNTNKQL